MTWLIWFALGLAVGAGITLLMLARWAESDQARRVIALRRAEDRIRDIRTEAMQRIADDALRTYRGTSNATPFGFTDQNVDVATRGDLGVVDAEIVATMTETGGRS